MGKNRCGLELRHRLTAWGGGGEFLGFVTFCTKEEGQPFETRTDDKCFFSSEMTDGFVIRRFARSYNA